MLYKPTHISLAVISLLSALALTACGGGGDDKGGNQSNNNQHELPASTLNTTYYEIEARYFSAPDVSKRYADVKEITIENGKVKTEIESREIGIGKADSWSNTAQSKLVFLAENFSFSGNELSESLIDTATSKMSFYPNEMKFVLIDSSNNNTLAINVEGKEFNLSGQKVYDTNNGGISTELTYKKGSVSEVYPQGASCWAVNWNTIFSGTDKPHWVVDTTHTSFANFSDWQNDVKQYIKRNKDSYIDGTFIDVNVGSNNEYAAQMVKIQTKDTPNNIKETLYRGAVEYNGKVYSSAYLGWVVHPDNKSENVYADCLYYNEVAKEYIIAQLKTLS